MDIPEIMDHCFSVGIQSRFNDFDVFNHVNNNAVMEYFDIGKSAFFHHVMGKGVSPEILHIAVVNINVTFYAQCLADEALSVLTCIDRVGASSLTLRQQLIATSVSGARTLKSEATSVMVCFDPVANTSVPIPEFLVKAISSESQKSL